MEEKSAVEWKEEGNSFFQNRKFKQAAAAYLEGLKVIEKQQHQQQESLDENLQLLRVNLHSNRAMVLLKTQDFEQAEQECTIVVEKYDGQNAKVWYRRALARESKALLMSTEQATLEGLNEAKTDLQAAMKVIKGTKASSTTAMIKDVLQAAQRIQMAMNNIEKARHEQRRKMIPKDLPEASKQREDVIALLKARKDSLKDRQPSGEALFLIDFDWWADWCFFVRFFHSQKNPSEIQLLPPGAVMPEEEDRKSNEDLPPEMIDNTELFLYPPDHKNVDPFYLHWYPKQIDGDRELPPLRPNLVRGYHYEIIPREVYHALRQWYGEITPSICRRTVPNGSLETCKIQLYPTLPTKSAPKLQPKSYCAACLHPGARQKCQRCLKVHYCGKGCQESHWPFHKEVCVESDPNFVTGPPSKGRVGLNQLGNTCFMNSALQALSHTTPLTRHFLSNRARGDINKTNPLGTGGELVKNYEGVLKELWLRNNSSSMSPMSLKRAIAQFAPRFAGYLQHDSQEFLAYFLDGLHEDLNRVSSKPYVEMPDIEDGENMAIAGARAWDQLRRRDDSLVLDTFYGQFRSTCVCPKCDRVSVAFDAFNHVSLQIPQPSEPLTVFSVMVFTEAHELPKRYSVELNRTERVGALLGKIAELSQIDPRRMVLCEVVNSRIFDTMSDGTVLGSLDRRNLLTAYEIDPLTANDKLHVTFSHALNETAEITDSNFEVFGFPLMMSFPASVSCQELWELVWKRVGHFTGEEGRNHLQMLYLGENGQVVAAFPREEVPVAEDETEKTPVLPKSCQESLVSFIGIEALSAFVQIQLVWLDSNGSANPADTSSLIDGDKFSEFEIDESYIDDVADITQEENSGVTLEKCFDTFIQPERLDERNMWYCSGCKEHVTAMKTMELWRLPNILVVHLKRFEFKDSLRREKLETTVRFPLDGLDMSRYCSSMQRNSEFLDDAVPAIYDCFAVINHFGRMGFGHYTAFARCFDENYISEEWDLFDDSHVRSVGSDNIVSPAAYVLFYRRRQFH